ncbi:hypothetical protein [Microvirga alba]|uniref:Uncharacterized protein n=1 Tax=Microvirga alba TaxID=2791025 RepID=A0A931FQU0_9HYPH|nr:hypothetical protein [Microvirga alba]MBF9235012.1 hypothetical protein [Microvirga alba]
MENGKDNDNEPENVVENLYNYNNITTTLCTHDLLGQRTLNGLKATFDRYGLSPTSEMWTNLRAAIQVMADMAQGSCASAYYVSSLDPGVGKTTAMIHFVRELVQSEDHKSVSALICLGRLEQIGTIVREIGLQDQDFAVLTGKDNVQLNTLGCGCPEEGRVLFTTHAMVESRCAGKPFSEVKALQFRGHVRQVRIWDEAILPGRPIALRRDSLASLLSVLRSAYPEFTEALEAFFVQFHGLSDKTLINVPSLDVTYDAQLHEVSKLLAHHPEELRKAVEDLWFLMGGMAIVRVDGHAGPTLVDYRQTLPDGLKPILALDASARVRATYDLWEKERGDLVRLPSAIKRYGNLTINVWDQGGGKSAYKNTGDVIVKGVLNAIAMKPHEEWLIVYHKHKPGRLNLPLEVSKGLPPDHKVSFLNWGAHDGTNEFKNVPNVILAGTLFPPLSHYEGLTRLSSGLSASKGLLNPDMVKAVTLGEHGHMILQALCRSSVRQNRNGECPPVTAYLIASEYSGIKGLLPELFPEAQIVSWMPVKKQAQGKVADAVSFVCDWFEANPDGALAYKDVRRAIGIKDASNFRTYIREHKKFRGALEELGLEEWGTGKYLTHLRRVQGFDVAA